MSQRYEYHDASCFGHALEGNLHLVFSQGFRNKAEVERFSAMMEEMCYLVATKHSGSLKGEHGTGRNVAPYVEMEWGTKAYDLMWKLKGMFDPEFVLNPGVVLNRDPDVHIKNLKPSPAASEIVNRCIECHHPTTHNPHTRHRMCTHDMVHWAAINTQRTQQQPKYEGKDTCAADGMCQEKCPVKINTGDLIKHIRTEEMKMTKNKSASGYATWLANNFGAINTNVPRLLNIPLLSHTKHCVGPNAPAVCDSAQHG
eukprot:gene10102-8001_t